MHVAAFVLGLVLLLLILWDAFETVVIGDQ